MTATGIDLSKWLTDREVCGRLGISPRTLHREVARGALHPLSRPRPGIRPERVFDPDEVESRLPPPPPRTLVPASPPPAKSAELLAGALGDQLAQQDAAMALVSRLVEMVAAARKPPKPWATLDEAADELGLSRNLLRRLVDRGDLEAVRDRALKVRREDLQDLDVTAELVKPAHPAHPAPKKRRTP